MATKEGMVSPIVIGTLVCKSFTDKFPKSNVYNIPISCKETMCIGPFLKMFNSF